VLPYACVILAIDTARRSGWSVWVKGQLLRWGETDVLIDRHVGQICEGALAHGLVDGLPVFLVLEKPFAGVDQGQYRGNWKAAFLEAGGTLRRVVQVAPATWRARVLGGGASRAKRDYVRKLEADVARWWTKTMTIGPDEAAAICIGAWARLCGEIGKRMPKKRKGKT
jgi:hypothetical protein